MATRRNNPKLAAWHMTAAERAAFNLGFDKAKELAADLASTYGLPISGRLLAADLGESLAAVCGRTYEAVAEILAERYAHSVGLNLAAANETEAEIISAAIRPELAAAMPEPFTLPAAENLGEKYRRGIAEFIRGQADSEARQAMTDFVRAEAAWKRAAEAAEAYLADGETPNDSVSEMGRRLLAADKAAEAYRAAESAYTVAVETRETAAARVNAAALFGPNSLGQAGRLAFPISRETAEAAVYSAEMRAADHAEWRAEAEAEQALGIREAVAAVRQGLTRAADNAEAYFQAAWTMRREAEVRELHARSIESDSRESLRLANWYGGQAEKAAELGRAAIDRANKAAAARAVVLNSSAAFTRPAQMMAADLRDESEAAAVESRLYRWAAQTALEKAEAEAAEAARILAEAEAEMRNAEAADLSAEAYESEAAVWAAYASKWADKAAIRFDVH